MRKKIVLCFMATFILFLNGCAMQTKKQAKNTSMDKKFDTNIYATEDKIMIFKLVARIPMFYTC